MTFFTSSSASTTSTLIRSAEKSNRFSALELAGRVPESRLATAIIILAGLPTLGLGSLLVMGIYEAYQKYSNEPKKIKEQAEIAANVRLLEPTTNAQGNSELSFELSTGSRVTYWEADSQLWVKVGNDPDDKGAVDPHIHSLKELKESYKNDMANHPKLYEETIDNNPDLKSLYRPFLDFDLEQHQGKQIDPTIINRAKQLYDLNDGDVHAAYTLLIAIDPTHIDGLQFLKLAQLHHVLGKIGTDSFNEEDFEFIKGVYDLAPLWVDELAEFNQTYNMELNGDNLPQSSDNEKDFRKKYSLDQPQYAELVGISVKKSSYDQCLAGVDVAMFKALATPGKDDMQVIFIVEAERLKPENINSKTKVLDGSKIRDAIRGKVHEIYRPDECLYADNPKGNKPKPYVEPNSLNSDQVANRNLLRPFNYNNYAADTQFCMFAYSKATADGLMTFKPIHPVARLAMLLMPGNPLANAMTLTVSKEGTNHYLANQLVIHALLQDVCTVNSNTLHVATGQGSRNGIV